MRRLPQKRSPKQKLIIKVAEDYFGEMNPEEKKSAVKISLWLMNRKKGISLTDEEKEIKETIRPNLQDKVYTLGLTGNPQLEMRSDELKPHLTPINSEVSPLKGSLTHLNS